MTAAICDDDEIFRVKLKEFLIGYKRERRIQIDILEFDCIHSFKGNIITLCNGERVTVSRSKLRDFKSAYMSFIKHFVTKL